MTKLPKPKFMMATQAFHKVGDITRPLTSLCFVEEEDEDNFYGQWYFGVGFHSIRFPKASTRPLNEVEVAYFSGPKDVDACWWPGERLKEFI